MINNKKNLAILLAAGSSSRFLDMTNDLNDIDSVKSLKQYKAHNDKYIIEYSLDNLIELKKLDLIEEILVVIRPEDNLFFEENILNKYNNQYKIHSCFGGKTRAMSVYNAINYTKNIMPDINFYNAIIHDSARPFASLDLFKNLINKIKNHEYDCCFPAIKIPDAVRLIKNNVFATVDRDGLFIVQTPQIFDFLKLKICFEYEFKNHISEFPLIINQYDEITMFEKFGGSISYIKGEKNNIKITFKDDLSQKTNEILD
jgi:2-C-methyl-D-erythritol 4-phosphate cytidylyltransferase